MGKRYDASTDGAVVAIRIYEQDTPNCVFPCAELLFAFGGSATIVWTNPEERNMYKDGINGYTYIYDERKMPSFETLKQKHKSIGKNN